MTIYTTLGKIKQKGYWKVAIQPLTYKKDRIVSLTQCKNIIGNAIVSLRGWPYPYYNNQAEQFQDHLQVDVDFEPHIEFWRLYLSGQFVHFIALNEDWLDYQRMSQQDSRFRNLKPGDILGFDLMVYDITEICEFISRLGKQKLFSEGVQLELTLVNTENRKLFIFDFNRADFFTDYRTSDNTLSYVVKVAEQEAIQDTKQNALNAILFFIDKFGWDKPNIESIKDMQQKLLERRL